MRRTDVDAALGKLGTYKGCDEEARKLFFKEVRDWTYKVDELKNAWLWFFMGWKAANKAIGDRG